MNTMMASVRTALLTLFPPVSVLLIVAAVRCLFRVAARAVGVEKGGAAAAMLPPVALYYYDRSCGGEEQQQQAECVFCLSGIEEGSEVRELKCRHLFHRGCLDRWLLARPLATCPLCRCRLLLDLEVDDWESESDSDMMLLLACVHSRSSWLWPS